MRFDLEISSPAVLLVAENGDAGGIGRYCVDMAGAMGDRASVVCLCTAPCPGAGACWLAGQCASRGARLVKIQMPAKALRAGRAGLISLWEQTGRPLIHVNGRRGNSVALAARLAVPGLRYVTTAHGLLGLHSRRNALYRLVDIAACRAASAVIAVSSDTARRLLRAGIPRTRMHVIPNALAETDIAALRAVADRRQVGRGAGGPLRIGFVGRLSPEKGPRELLQVARALYESGAKATVAIAGDGPDRAWMERESDAMRQSKYLTFHGVVHDSASFLEELDVLVMPSRNEGLPFVLLEAMAAGCAVVAFGVGGIPEVVGDPSLGTLVRPGDVGALEAALRRLCDDPAAAASIGQAASAHVQQHYSLERRLPLVSQAYGFDV